MRAARAQAIARYLEARGYIVGKAGSGGLEIFTSTKGPTVVEVSDRMVVSQGGYQAARYRHPSVSTLSLVFVGRRHEIYRLPEQDSPRGVAERIRSIIETHEPAMAAQAADRLENQRRTILDNEERRARYQRALDADRESGFRPGISGPPPVAAIGAWGAK